MKGGGLTPIETGERIEELDVVRGFALLGVFLMNVEFFNRSLMGIGEGIDPSLTGIDYAASWFVTYFVQGKFWTIFSLLFGMGFAVMLMRAERAERPFMKPYLRRILALAVFGSMHFLFLWAGDILLSYAIAAAGLLILRHGTWKWIVLAMVVLIGLAFVPGLSSVGQTAGSLGFIGLVALYLRNEKKVWRWRIPVFALIFLILGTLGALVSTLLWVMPGAPEEARIPATITSAFFLITAYLSGRYHDPIELRPLRLGLAIYVLPSLIMIGISTAQYFSPPKADDALVVQMAIAKAGPAAVELAPLPVVPETTKPDADTVKERIERAKDLAELAKRKHDEVRVLSTGTYGEAVEMRAKLYPKHFINNTGLAVIAMGMFLIGFWFVRSGIMENARAHMQLFRRLAWFALPAGIAIGVLGSLIATSRTWGVSHDPFQIAQGLSMLGSLAACLGYVGLVIVALHSNTVFAKVRVLAPVGRMALTNYLLQSLVSTLVFYGYGGGQWGMGRAWQVVFVLGVFALQVLFSHWWLARFRYGPLEGVWRAFTYGQPLPLRSKTAR